MSMRRQYGYSVYQKRLMSSSNLGRRYTSFSISNPNQIINSNKAQDDISELVEIENLIYTESNLNKNPPFQSVNQLSLYIRRNRNNIEEIIRKISRFFDTQNNNLNDILVVDIINSILNLLTEKSQIINFLNIMLPIMVNSLNFQNKGLYAIENINNTIGRLIKIGGIYTRKIIDSNIDSLFDKFSNDKYNFKYENTKFSLILFLCKIIENSALFAYNKLTEKNTFEIFLKILDNFKDPKYEVRCAVGELIKQFIHTLVNRDYKTKFCYLQMIYFRISSQYLKHLQENNDIPSSHYMILGFIEVLRKIYTSEPIYFKDKKRYIELVDNLMKCQNSKIPQIKVDYIKFVPELYQINKEIFLEQYINDFLEFGNKLLTMKSPSEIRNSLLLTMGSLSLVIKKEILANSINQLIGVIKSLIMEKDTFDKEIFKCLADLLNNKENTYIEAIVTKFNIYYILEKLFKSGLTPYKMEFLLSLMSSFSNFSMEHIATVISSLNVISLILIDEDIELEYFNKGIAENRNNFIDPRLDKILTNTRKHIRKCIDKNNNIFPELAIKNMSENNSSSFYFKCKCINDPKTIIIALTLFSQIENNLFLKDMLIFYNEKILPFLLFASNKICKKILDLILCKFVKIYPDDTNLSNYILNNIVDSIRNLIFTSKDKGTKVYAFNILHKKKLLHDIILSKKNFFSCKLIGILSSNEDNIIKEKMIQTVGLLSLRKKDKNFFIMFVKKNINNILFTIHSSDDIIHIENLITLLLYFTIYLKNVFDLKLVQQIMKELIDLILNIDYNGIIMINVLKIVYEILNTDLIINQFLINNNYNEKISEYCHLLLIICINNLKEGGVNTPKSEISLKALYQIIKIQKINIYNAYKLKTFPSPKGNTNFNISNLNYDANINNENRKFLNFKENKNKINNQYKVNNNEKDIRNNNYNIELLLSIEKADKIYLVELFLQCLIKGATDESLKTIMSIFGLSGAMEPSKMEKFFINQGLSIYHLEGTVTEQDSIDDNEYKIVKFNTKTKVNEEIDLSSIDPSTYKPVLSLMRILKENSQQELSIQIISCLSSLINSLTPNEENLIEVILPTIIKAIPQFEENYQKTMFDNLLIIINKFKNKIKASLNELIKLLKNYIMIESCLDIICKILENLFDQFIFEMEIYYPLFIPIFLSLIKNGAKESLQLIKIFTSMTKNVNIIFYLNNILGEITIVFLKEKEENILSSILIFIEKIVSLENTYLFYPLIINTLIEKIKNLLYPEYCLGTINEKDKILKLTKEKLQETMMINSSLGKNLFIINKTLDIFIKMNENNRENFIRFLPMIVKNYKNNNIIQSSDCEWKIKSLLIDYSDYTFMSKEGYLKKIFSQNCIINCVFSFGIGQAKQNNITTPKKIKNSKTSKKDENQQVNKGRITPGKKETNESIDNEIKNKFPNQPIKSRKTQINNEIIIKIFDATNCVVEEDWNEWFKSTSKILFEQSPSYALFYCHEIVDYYFPLILELYNYGFFSVYINNNDQNKIRLTNDLKLALENPKTPNDILLTILNLAEFIERRNVNMCFIDYYQFGEVAYKCRAFAKALYYKENDFIIKNDFDNLEDLIELYYELKHPESAKGLLKLAEKNKEKMKIKNFKNNNNKILDNKDKENDEKEYIWYIKLHNYEEALNLINKQIENEKKIENIETLKKNRDLCLNGLCDWEELLSSNDNNDNASYISIYNHMRKSSNISNYNDNLIKQTIEKEILLSKACMNLGEWNQLKIHFSKINQIFRNSYDKDKEFIINMANEDKKNDNYCTNDITEETIITSNNSSDKYFIPIKTDSNRDSNKEQIENDYLNLNKYLTNYRKRSKSLVNKTKEYSVDIARTFTKQISCDLIGNSDDLPEEEIFISYNELANNNSNLNFLENNEETLFDLNFYSSVLNIQEGKYKLANDYIYEAKKMVLSRIKSLLSESYIRGYELLIKNQMLFNLEQIIEYKQNHFDDKLYLNQMVSSWDKNLEIIGKDPFIYEKFLSLRALVLPIEKEYDKYMNLAKICRKLNLYKQCEKVLTRLKNKMNLSESIGNSEDLLINEIQIKIELNYNKCLFEKGEINEAIDRSKYLVDLLEASENQINCINNSNDNSTKNNLFKINNKIKSKIYGNYAIYKQTIFDYNKSSSIKQNKNENFFLSHKNFLRTYSMESNIQEIQNSFSTIVNNNKNLNIYLEGNEPSNIINYYFSRATEYNETNYNFWHNYAMFNYKNYKYVSSQKDEVGNSKEKEIIFALYSAKAFENSLKIGGKNMNKTFQDLLRLIDIFFSSGSKNKELLSLISSSFNAIDEDAYLNVIPQLLCRFDLNESKVLEVLINTLIKIGQAHPHALIYPLIVMKHSNSKRRKSASIQVLNSIMKNNEYFKKLVEECEMFITELNRCAMLLHEEWYEEIEDIAKVFQEKDYNGMVNQVIKLHEKMSHHPENMYDVNFYQKFGSELKEAEKYIKHYIKKKSLESLKNAWEIYHHLYKDISDSYKKFEYLSLEYISPKLYNFRESNISLPGTYNFSNISIDPNKGLLHDKKKDKNNKTNNIWQDKNKYNIVHIQKIINKLIILNTKQHPRKMSMIGTDEKEYIFLLKGHEDLRQDERAMQLFDLVNTILTNNKDTRNKNLYINTYSVLPLSHNAGIIGWVPNCDTLHQLIKEQRTVSNTIPSVEHRKVYKLYPKFETGTFLGKVEIFKEALFETHGTELNNIIWIKSKNCETWLNRRTNYSRSLAVMSIVGYILGLGDRHPSNLMMSRETGKIIHIDFGDCFEVSMKRDKFPEKVPFRLTRMLIKALEVSGIEGTFRLICIKIMELLRNNKDSLLAILGSFIHDPLISFRLLIPMIMKKKQLNSKIVKSKKKKTIQPEKESKIKFAESSQSASVRLDSIPIGKLTKLLKNSENNKKESGEEEKVGRVSKEEEKIDVINEEEEKNEKKKRKDDERQIFNLFEENDEIESEELNKIAQIVLERIQDKLSGTDFNPHVVYDEKIQVDKLIRQATSYENLAQSYLGWCPFW